jgi:hypothetical protein
VASDAKGDVPEAATWPNPDSGPILAWFVPKIAVWWDWGWIGVFRGRDVGCKFCGKGWLAPDTQGLGCCRWENLGTEPDRRLRASFFHEKKLPPEQTGSGRPGAVRGRAGRPTRAKEPWPGRG